MVYNFALKIKTGLEGEINTGETLGQKGGERMSERNDLEKMLKRLKKDFQKNIQPVLKKHNYFISKGERTRLKRAKAIRRMRRRERQFSRAA